MITYRTMTAADIPGGLALCRIAGWNQIYSDWQLFLDHDAEGAIVAVAKNNSISGTAATIRYGEHFCWIGMVLVDPSKRNQGIGTQLLQRSLDILKNESCIKLDATPAGREIYLKLGFVDEYELSRMQTMTPDIRSEVSPEISPMKKTDLDAVFATDERVFGADRKKLLTYYFNAHRELCYTAKNEDGVAGYCFGRSGHLFTSIGPVIAGDEQTARQLTTAALKSCSGPVIMDVPHLSQGFIQWLADAGFTEQRKLIRMYKGTNDWPGVPQLQFSILGPEFG